MKRIILALTTAAALTLTGCAGSPGAEPAPAPTTSQAAETSAPTSTPAPTPEAAPEPAPSTEPATEPISNEDQAMNDWVDCMNAAETQDDELTCDEYYEYDQQMADHVEGTLWGCWLELEKTRPELFTSAEPSQYATDPEVVAVCGAP